VKRRIRRAGPVPGAVRSSRGQGAAVCWLRRRARRFFGRSRERGCALLYPWSILYQISGPARRIGRDYSVVRSALRRNATDGRRRQAHYGKRSDPPGGQSGSKQSADLINCDASFQGRSGISIPDTKMSARQVLPSLSMMGTQRVPGPCAMFTWLTIAYVSLPMASV
jgi:hypothetical protein